MYLLTKRFTTKNLNMKTSYGLVTGDDYYTIVTIAERENWLDECFKVDSLDLSNKGFKGYGLFVPKSRLDIMTKVSRKTLTSHLLKYQLNIVGKSIVDTLDNDKWRFQWVISKLDYTTFRGYAVPLIKKVLRCNRLKAESSFDWFYQVYGLRIRG